MVLPLWRLRTWQRKLFETFGSDRFSKPEYGNIHKGLDKYFENPGFFIEAGALDGFLKVTLII